MNATNATPSSPAAAPSWLGLAEANGGIWGEHPDHAATDWAQAVLDGETRAGYWQWVENNIEEARLAAMRLCAVEQT